jgi:hypothetical protein
MSQYMQIDIRLLPFYEKGFSVHFPKLSKVMEGQGYLKPGEEAPSLYVLVDVLDRMNLDPILSSPVKEGFRPFLEDLKVIKERAREHLLGRRLNELDAVLYELEDEFEALERSL